MPRTRQQQEDPPLQNKHQRKTEATKRKLLRSALRVFARDGFEAARLEDIAVDAGHTRGAFYAHFRSKEDLFFALLENESHKHRERIRRVLEDCPTREAGLRALREYYVKKVADRQWSILTLEFKLYALRHPKLRARLAQMHRSIRTKMKWEGLERIWPRQAQCTPKSADPRRLALQVTLNALVLERAYDPASITEAQMSALLRRLFDFLVSE